MVTLTPKHTIEYLLHAIPAGINVLLTGKPGCGKTAVTHTVSDALEYDHIETHLATCDPTDGSGVPFPNREKGIAEFLPAGELAQVFNATRPTLWLMDDFGQASPAVQAAFMPFLRARQCKGRKLPDCVRTVLCTNGRDHKAGVSGVLWPVSSRSTIINVETDIDSWSEWAMNQPGFDPFTIAFLRSRPELLSTDTPPKGIENGPTPRNWEDVSKNRSLNLPKHLQLAVYSGNVGQGAAIEYIAWLDTLNNMISLDSVLASPDTAPIPTQMSQLYATAVGLAFRASQKTFPAIATYLNRLLSENHGPFAALCIADSLKRDSTLKNSAAYVSLITGQYGSLLTGMAQEGN